jgi:hypothetical protein
MLTTFGVYRELWGKDVLYFDSFLMLLIPLPFSIGPSSCRVSPPYFPNILTSNCPNLND